MLVGNRRARDSEDKGRLSRWDLEDMTSEGALEDADEEDGGSICV